MARPENMSVPQTLANLPVFPSSSLPNLQFQGKGSGIPSPRWGEGQGEGKNHGRKTPPHSSRAPPYPEPQPTRGNGSPHKSVHRTPTMAAGVIDRIWRWEDLLLW